MNVKVPMAVFAENPAPFTVTEEPAQPLFGLRVIIGTMLNVAEAELPEPSVAVTV